MKRIDSDALSILTKSLGLEGMGSQVTELNDGVVDQALSVNDVVRRGRTLGPTGGLFIGLLRNNHAGADSLTATVNPFNVTTALAFPPFPSPIPEQFDLWLLQANVGVVGAGSMTAALFVNFPAASFGFSVTNAGGQVAAAVTSHPVAFWDAVVTENVIFGLLNGARGPQREIGIRLPRSGLTQLIFASTAAGAGARTFDLRMVLGLFPVSLGQDGLV